MAVYTNMTGMGKEQITVSTTAVPLTATAYAPNGLRDMNVASFATVDVESNGIRYWDDGSVPTASVGNPITAGVRFEIRGIQAIRDFLAIRSGAADATLSITYYREGP